MIKTDRHSARFEYSDDCMDEIYQAREGIFDELIETEKRGDGPVFPLYHHNNFIALAGNISILQNLLNNEVLIERTLFDGERSAFHFNPNDAPIELMKQGVSNREMINRQFELLKKHFLEEKK